MPGIKIKTRGVISHSADGDSLRASSRDRKTTPKRTKAKKKKGPPSPSASLKFLSDSVDGICRKCTKGIDDAREDSIYCDRCKGCLHIKCAEMSTQEFEYIKRATDTKLIYQCPVCVKELSDGNGEDDRIAQQNARLDSLTEFVQLIITQNKALLEAINKKPDIQEKKTEDDIQVQLTEVIQNQSEVEEKKKNLIVFNVPEAEESDDDKKEQEEDVTKVKEILSFLDKRLDTSEIDIKNVTRMGNKKGKDVKPRAIKITLPSVDMKYKAIRNAKKLTDFKTPKIGISFDKTKKEIKEDQALKQLLEDTKKNDPESDPVIFERKVVTRAEATRLRGLRDAKRGNSNAPAN